MDLWSRLDDLRARWDVLQHPFYQRWSEGTLSREELATYAGQYRHAVVALADASEAAAAVAEPALRDELAEHAAEERAHVDLWDGFLAAMGGDASAAATPETAACARAWAGDGDLVARLVGMYAIESGQPPISATKLAGLRAHYGFSEGPATAYFELHRTRDVEHAAAERALIEPRLAGADVEAAVAAAEGALRGNWELLDGVERLNGR